MSHFALRPVASQFLFADDDEVEDAGMHQAAKERPWLRRYSKLVCLATFCLLFMGALVTSNQAGLAVPDWPTSYGHNMFTFPISMWQGNIFYEHVHRLIASGVGLLTLILAAWLFAVERRRWVRRLGYLALLMVIIQGVLGGVTVLMQLPDLVSSAHGVLGQTFFVVTIALAYSQSREFSKGFGVKHSIAATDLLRPALACFLLVYIQLIVGAVMRHSDSGLAIPDFPTMGGYFVPTFSDEMLQSVNDMRAELDLAAVSLTQVGLHLAHRFAGVMVLFGVVLFFVKALVTDIQLSAITRVSFFALLVVCMQFFLGVATVLSEKNAWITSLHVIGGALLLGSLTLLSLRLFRASRP
ncbi:MAG: hypothetical protein DCC75_06385 [Proteobacteria bacterium]|nr:MAG: hypothetical protein DCC75_06385 [Pseudomonadota bacterium]